MLLVGIFLMNWLPRIERLVAAILDHMYHFIRLICEYVCVGVVKQRLLNLSLKNVSHLQAEPHIMLRMSARRMSRKHPRSFLFIFSMVFLNQMLFFPTKVCLLKHSSNFASQKFANRIRDRGGRREKKTKVCDIYFILACQLRDHQAHGPPRNSGI